MSQPDLPAARSPAGKGMMRAEQGRSPPREVGQRGKTKGKKQLDKDLDRALEDSFPASDPPARSQPTGTEPAGDPKTKP